MGSMERGLSRDEILDAWQASGPRQASAAACVGRAQLRPDCGRYLPACIHALPAGWCCACTPPPNPRPRTSPLQAHPEGAGERFLDVSAILRSRRARLFYLC